MRATNFNPSNLLSQIMYPLIYGNLTTDRLLVIIVMYFTSSMIVPYISTYYNRIYTYLFGENKCTLVIRNDVPNVPKYIKFYISEIMPDVRTYSMFDTGVSITNHMNGVIVRSNSNKEGRCVYTVDWDNTNYSFKFMDETINAWFAVNRDNNRIVDSEITLCGNSIEILKNFIRHARTNYYKKQLIEKGIYIYTKKKNDNNFNYDNSIFKKIKQVQNKTFENTIVNRHTKDKILHSLETFYKDEKRYKHLGIPYKKGLMFYGTPGTGKTSMVYAIANKFNMNIYRMDTIEDLKHISHDTVKEKSIILIDDCDSHSIMRKRFNKNNFGQIMFHAQPEIVVGSNVSSEPFTQNMNNGDNNTNNDTEQMTISDKIAMKKYEDETYENKNMLLTTLDGTTIPHGCLIIMITNHIEEIDDAVYRPGRIDEKFEINYIDTDTVVELIRYYTDIDEYEPVDYELEYFENNDIKPATLIHELILPNINNINTVDDLHCVLHEYIENVE